MVLTWVACNVRVALVPPETITGGAVVAGAALGVGAAALEDEAGAHAVARVALLRVAAVGVRVALGPPDHLLALPAVVDQEPLRAGTCNGAGGQRVKHGALLPHRAGVLRAAGVVAALVGAGKLGRAVGIHPAFWVIGYHSCLVKWKRSRLPCFTVKLDLTF